MLNELLHHDFDRKTLEFKKIRVQNLEKTKKLDKSYILTANFMSYG